MCRWLPLTMLLLGFLFAEDVDAQVSRGSARPTTGARPAANRPATTAKAGAKTTTAKTTTKTAAKATPGAKGVVVTPNPASTFKGVVIPARNRTIITTPVVIDPPTAIEDVRAAQRRRTGAGGPLIGGSLGGPGLVLAECVPLRPLNTNRPYAGKYSWYHGSWSGWAAWPPGWAGEGAGGPPGAEYANPYQGVPPATGPLTSSSSRRAPMVLSPGLRAALDYSKPIRPVERSTKIRTVETAQEHLDVARYAFRRGNYRDGLTQVERGIETLPGDANLHEFRALSLFALGCYKDAAATLHPVLAADAGWSWETMSSFYPKTDLYTAQLRDLEEHVEDNPEDPAGRFLLGYHYLVLDDRDAALEQMQEVVKLQPKDAVAKTLLESLEKDRKEPRGKRK